MPTFGPGPGGSGQCDGDFDPQPLFEQAPEADPDQALCFAGCEGSDEITCVATDRCRAIYGSGGDFVDCWGTAPSGPAPDLVCENLGAYECSRTDHCAALHTSDGNFASCEDEKTPCTSDNECDGNDTCSTNAGECLGGPGCQFTACGDVCWGFCQPPDTDPGSCVGEVACDLPEPDCPSGTIAGRTPDCWTGYCIPVASCDSTDACSGLNEIDCTAATSCTGLYRGEDCSCDPIDGCNCTAYTFEGCGDA